MDADDGEASRTAVARKPAPGLYVVATPIGNLEDLTRRAERVLATADLVLCEDTRVTGNLLRRLGIRAAALLPYHEHNAARVRPRALARLREGAVVALASDAGTPLVSDPGFKLVREAADEGLPVFAVPGPSAVLAALCVAGLPTDRFLFQGFLPAKPGARARVLDELAGVRASLVLFESAQRLAETLGTAAERLGPRPAAVARELTKLHEEVRRGDLAGLAAAYGQEPPPRGEIVIVIAPPGEDDAPSEGEVDTLLRRALNRGSVKDAVAEVASITGQSRSDVYRRALALSKETGNAAPE